MPRPKPSPAVALVVTLAIAGCGTHTPAPADSNAAGATTTASPSASPSANPTPERPSPTPPPPPPPPELPQGGRTIFPQHRIVAYYGTAGSGALGVLGEAGPDRIVARLRTAAAPFTTRDRKLQVAFELIATVADARPGPDGDYSHDIDPAEVQRYVDAARRHKALIVLDIQPGRSDFLTVVKRYRRFLEQPHVGIALDPEWRMPPGEVPGRTIGRVSAAEVNAVSAYVAQLIRQKNLPEKLFLLHQFRASMLPDVWSIQRRPGLAMVQHVDGFGTRSEKDATYARIRRPYQFHLGYKLFYDEDVNMYGPRNVLTFQPPPVFISYQ